MEGKKITVLKDHDCNTNVISRGLLSSYKKLLNIQKIDITILYWMKILQNPVIKWLRMKSYNLETICTPQIALIHL